MIAWPLLVHGRCTCSRISHHAKEYVIDVPIKVVNLMSINMRERCFADSAAHGRPGRASHGLASNMKNFTFLIFFIMFGHLGLPGRPAEARAALCGHGAAGRGCRGPIHPARLRQGVAGDLHTLTNGTQKHRWSGYDHHASPPASAATLTKTRAGHGHIGLGASGGLDLAWASSSLDTVSGFGAR